MSAPGSLVTGGVSVGLPFAAGRVASVVALVSGGQETYVLAGGVPVQRARVVLPLPAAGWAGRLMKAVVG
ncbi:hypothetical protein [Streptomyces jumonjinensis]|uniref:hypothetical protein n=1 Tax=Streptomyces jumonjinensis TaxID=1945 RepID=UPI00379EEA7D